MSFPVISRSFTVACILSLAAGPLAQAADIIKANNTTALNDAGSWVSGGPPTASDVAVWDSTLGGVNSSAIGASLSVAGLKVTNPGGAITIADTTGATLTLGTSGIDMSTATQNLTLEPNLAIDGNQSWTVAGGRSLNALATSRVGSGTGNIGIVQAGSGTANVFFNRNGNNANWNGYSGNVTVGANVRVLSQGNAAAAFGSGTVTVAGGEIVQREGNWTFGNNIDVTSASVIGNDSSLGLARTLKLLGDLSSSNSSGLTFTNNITGGTRTDNMGFLLAGANPSTYGTTTISANSRVRVGGNSTATIVSPGWNAGDRGSLGTGDVTLAAATSELGFTRTDAHTVANNISGSGTVVIGGNTTETAGTSTQVVTLSGTNTYTGATRVSRSRLNLTGTMTSAITVDNAGSISGTGSTTGGLTLSSGAGIALAGGATTTSLTVNGATFGGSNVVTFFNAATPSTVYDVFTYGSGTVTDPGNLTVAWRGTLSDDTLNQKYIFTAGNVGTRTWTQDSGTWLVGTAGSWSGGDDIYYNGDTAVFNEPTTDSTLTLTGPIAPGGVEVNNTTNSYTFTGTSIEGAGTLTKAGSGILTLATANTFTGGTTLTAGRIRVGVNTALGTGTIGLNGGAISSDSGTTRTLANDLTIGGNVRLGDGTNNGLLVFDGSVNLQAATRTIDSQLTAGLGARLSGVISNGGLTLDGSNQGVLTLSNNANTFAGPTTVTNGYLAVSTNAIATSSSVSLANSARLYVGETGTTNINNLSGTASTSIRTDFTITGANGNRVISVNQTTDGIFEGSFAQGSNRPILLIKEGAATLTLTGTGSYTGTTTVNGGTLKISGAGLLGGSSYGGAISNAATLQFDSSATQTLTGPISGAGALSKTGTGTLILTNNNNYTGAITIDGGTLQIGNNATGGFIGNSATVTNNASLVWYRSNDTNVANAISGTGSLTKLGSGFLALNGVNTYTGATTVDAGTLRVNGSLASGSVVTVQAAGTLGGTGTIGGATTIFGTHSPGNSPGVQTFGSDLGYDGATVIWELTGNTSTQTDPAVFDQVIVGNNLDFASASALSLVFDDPSSLVNWNDTFWNTDQEWLLYDVAGTTTNLGNLSINTASWGDGFGNVFATVRPDASFSLRQATGSDDVLLSYVAVPEPGTLALAGCGLALAGWQIVRRRRVS